MANAAPLTSWGERPDLAQSDVTAPRMRCAGARITRVNLGSDRASSGELALINGPRSASRRNALAVAKPFVEPLDQILRGLGDDGAGREYRVRARLAKGGEVLARG